MQKRIIIVGDSFSLGVGAQYPEIFEQVHPLVPKISADWLNNFTTAQREYFENYDLSFQNENDKIKPALDTMAFLTNAYHDWIRSVYHTDIAIKHKEINGRVPKGTDLKCGVLSSRPDYTNYPHIWSNVLETYLDDTEVINISAGGRSMSSVVSALSTWININNDHDKYETLVFFQAPDPARKQLVATTNKYEYNPEDEFTPFDIKMECVNDYHISQENKITPYRDADDSFDFSGHNKMYIAHDMYIGEWYQNIYNAQQICKANNFSFAWTTSALSYHIMQEKKNGSFSYDDDQFKNVLGLDNRLDRNVVTLDKTFVSLHFKHLQLGVLNLEDKGYIMDGTQHFSRQTQQLFAKYLATSIISKPEWWWQA